ncbi:kinetochore protein nuf2 [Venturia nashicola]|uniref:Probable kinetochore protein NUF2 n=1 Tax=Venturia nashicola TaxID=86259 RepID=A0A4Z1PA76_9PEZI|nr:kinetochore protein nuf2 [Venturia nashicola]TLD38200.1 kinetochore protein nuf2 [Venturia nashicola]
MDFNGRMSMARISQPQTGRKQQQEPDDAFMMPDQEIATCITEIGIHCTLEDLRKPNPQHVQKMFEFLVFITMNMTRDIVSPAMRAAAEELAGPEAERLYTADTRDLMGFFTTLRRLLVVCGIDDLTFSDLYRPTYGRIVKILSYVINFIRFRESHTATMDKHLNEAERTKMRVQQLYADKENLEAQLSRMQRESAAVEKANKVKEEQFPELKAKLRTLDSAKDRLQAELKKNESDLERLKTTYEQRATALDELRDEAARLKPYTLQKPETLETNMRELNMTLSTEKSQIELLERRTRALQTSFDAFNTVSIDVQSLSRLLTDLSSDLQKEEDEQSKAARHRDALSERVSSVEDVERQERMMQKQLDGISSRTEKLRRGAEEKSEGARVKMEELQGMHSVLARERSEKSREVERRRVRIEQVEKKMADLKEQIELEVQAAREEYVKMESHIRLYINEMEQGLSGI